MKIKHLLLLLPLAACVPAPDCPEWRCGPESASGDRAAPAAPDAPDKGKPDRDKGKPDRDKSDRDKGKGKSDRGKGKGEKGDD